MSDESCDFYVEWFTLWDPGVETAYNDVRQYMLAYVQGMIDRFHRMADLT
jgi:hypothetical protein